MKTISISGGERKRYSQEEVIALGRKDFLTRELDGVGEVKLDLINNRRKEFTPARNGSVIFNLAANRAKKNEKVAYEDTLITAFEKILKVLDDETKNKMLKHPSIEAATTSDPFLLLDALFTVDHQVGHNMIAIMEEEEANLLNFKQPPNLPTDQFLKEWQLKCDRIRMFQKRLGVSSSEVRSKQFLLCERLIEMLDPVENKDFLDEHASETSPSLSKIKAKCSPSSTSARTTSSAQLPFVYEEFKKPWYDNMDSLIEHIKRRWSHQRSNKAKGNAMARPGQALNQVPDFPTPAAAFVVNVPNGPKRTHETRRFPSVYRKKQRFNNGAGKGSKKHCQHCSILGKSDYVVQSHHTNECKNVKRNNDDRNRQKFNKNRQQNKNNKQWRQPRQANNSTTAFIAQPENRVAEDLASLVRVETQ